MARSRAPQTKTTPLSFAVSLRALTTWSLTCLRRRDRGTINPPGLALNSWAFGRTVVEVRDSNVDSVDVLVHQGVDLNGVVLVDGRPCPLFCESRSIPDDGWRRRAWRPGAIFSAQVAQFQPAIAADGRFTIPMLPEGRYQFEMIFGEPPQVRTQSARADGTAVAIAAVPKQDSQVTRDRLPRRHPSGGFERLRQRPQRRAGWHAPVEVLIRTDGGNVDGIVIDAQQKAVAHAFVALVPASNRQNSARFKTTHSDALGRFALRQRNPALINCSLPSTHYHSMRSGSLFLSKIENLGLTVTVPPPRRCASTSRLLRSRRHAECTAEIG